MRKCTRNCVRIDCRVRPCLQVYLGTARGRNHDNIVNATHSILENRSDMRDPCTTSSSAEGRQTDRQSDSRLASRMRPPGENEVAHHQCFRMVHSIEIPGGDGPRVTEVLVYVV